MRRARLPLVLCLLGLAALLVFPQTALAQKGKKGADQETAEEEKDDVMSAGTFAGLSFRGIGPGIASGRITDVVVHPEHKATWYVTVASGGVWKTTDGAISWQPIFDSQGSYSIGCITMDPNDPLTLWVGTGENNSQRSVGYGDGVYRSRDGGTSWEHVGLKESEHIGKIVVDPRDSNTVFVAAQGPLWSAGGDRGLYKTTDGGESWEKVLEISEHTGVTDLVYDPRNPDVMYAASYQRRRHTWTLINGGPESAIYKTTDGGANWRKVTNGLPKVELGRIGLAIAHTRPDTLYAIVEAAEDEDGFYRSTDRGENWKKMSDYVASSPQYYNELFVDPVNPDRVYSMDTFGRVSDDGGASWRRIGSNARHVDDHALWIDPDNTAHLLIGCDGGLYESFNGGETWRFFDNLPITQFYKIAIDQAEPFYNVYGGTQDNNTLGGPTRTNSGHGIMNREWFVTVSGDGFEPAVDPTNPDIIYSQWQYGGLVRYDKKSGEIVDIQPQPEPGDPPPRWNWSSALILSPHSPTRLYYGSQRLWKSDDRGDTWQPISDDLTRDLDRNELEVMGRVWGVDSVAKNNSTSYYGTLVSLTESPLAEGLLYTGSDDGLVHVSEDDGANWRRVDDFPGVPEQSYVSFLAAAVDDADTVYAAFDNHKQGDFKPYVLKSTDRGATWTSISGDLPERGTVYALAQDGEDPDLLFAGTEFGVWFTLDGGGHWIELSGGVPTIAVYDLELQRRENDVVLGTFGRGFYVLDDYSPLRDLTREQLDGEGAILFAPRDAKLYVEATELGFPGKGFQGDGLYAAPNPPFGAVFTWYMKEAPKSLSDQRR
ncbi:MAG TPA: glycosyl hydrolase, partial [Thermoanaerobaculia bacterium]|nr:glycosyl hydrolase [Thermoanaerobaculia bacterium]